MKLPPPSVPKDGSKMIDPTKGVFKTLLSGFNLLQIMVANLNWVTFLILKTPAISAEMIREMESPEASSVEYRETIENIY